MLVGSHSRFYVTAKLGPRMSLTPAGFLLCEEVPIARTGSLVYGPGETDIEVGPQGFATVDCDADELFRPETIASFNGMPFLNEHPDTTDSGVHPNTWRDLARGTVLNPHRGGPGQDNLLLADLMICDQELIEEVLGLGPGELTELLKDPERIKDTIGAGDGKREVSCGYDADYEELEPGRGKKTNIIGNHVAGVGSGRCGTRCQIQDHLPERTRKMAKANGIMARLRAAIKTKDAAGAAKILDEEVGPALAEEEDDETSPAGGTHTHIHLHQGEKTPTQVDDDDEETPEEKAAREAAAGGGGGGRTKFTDDELEKRFKMMGDSLEEIKGMIGKKAPAAGEGEGSEEGVKENPDGYLEPKEGDAAMKYKDGDKEIEGAIEEEAPEGTGDKARKATDSDYLTESHRETVALAEILAPGVKVPTFDRAWNPKITADNLCRLRRKALTQGLTDADTKEVIEAARGGKTTDAATIGKFTCASLRPLFYTAANLKRTRNNDSRQTVDNRTSNTGPKPITSITEMNKRNAEFYK